jgi:hypothetical protein
VGSIHTGGNCQAGRYKRSIVISFKNTYTYTCYRGGAGAARGAHNSEDIGSKPISGIFQNHINTCCLHYLTQTMESGRRVEQMKAVQAEALELFTRKNTDYGDAFAKYGVIGVLMRIEDKLQRSLSITKNGVNLVADEGIRDTLIDLHNYAAMAMMLLDE